MYDLVADCMIRRLVARFANSFDVKAWDVLGDCLTETLYTDYSDLRGTPPEMMSRARFVVLRRAALQELRTHHLAGNVEISLSGECGVAAVSMIIYRQKSDQEQLTSHCVYTLGVVKEIDGWRIRSIVQKVLWKDGTAAIHSGITSQQPPSADSGPEARLVAATTPLNPFEKTHDHE